MLLFIFSITSLIAIASSEYCYHQTCRHCRPEIAAYPGTSKECVPSNWVTPQWIHDTGHPPPTTDSKIAIEYRCLKMVATPDDKSFGNTVDVIRGCIPKAQVDSVCNGLIAIENSRGHSDARCFVCRGDNCNFTTSTRIPFHIPISILILYFVFR